MQDAPTLIEQYQRLLRHGEADAARACLALALQVPAYRAEAQVLQGMQAFQDKEYAQAFIQFWQAAKALPSRTEIAALMGKTALAQRQAELATQLLEAAWRKDPKHTGLRITLWQARLASQPAATTLKQLHVALEHVIDANELRLVLQLLAQLSPPDSMAGTVQYDAVQGVIHGWAVNLHAPDTPASLQVRVGDRHATFTAQQPHPLLDKAGWPATHGAFRVKLAPQREPVRILALAQGAEKAATATELTDSPLALAPVLPGVPGHTFTALPNSEALPAKADQPAVAAPTLKKPGKNPGKNAKPAADQKRIDVLIPVYDGHDETLACIHSVLRARQANRSQHDIIVLNDASPNAALTQALSQLAQSGKIIHVVRPANLGFIRNMNRGMALHPDRDVVWLNADTQVHGNWLDRLRAAAYASRKTASAAPFTNNGELLSFPESRVSHPMPTTQELAQLDNLAKKQPATPIPIETGCGFCLYIKRSALDAVGYLDEITLQRGYGEETDWCLRARGLGWQHVAAPNVFVAHQGGVSFKDEKTLRVQHNNDILRKRYPGAQARYKAISRNDPLAPARQALQRARLALLPGWMRNHQQEDMQQHPESPRTLYLCGGLREQAGLPPIEAPLRLSFANKGMLAIATLQAMSDGLPLELSYDLPADASKLVKDLQGLPLESLVYAQTTGCPEALLQLPRQLKLPHSVRGLPLHQATGNAALKALLDTAQTIHVPYPAMVLAYRKALPQANIAVLPAPALPRLAGLPNTVPSLLVADALQHPAAGAHWLDVAHTLAHRRRVHGSAPTLLIPGNTPWQEQLLATGVAAPVPKMEGLDMKQALVLAGCTVAVSLDSNPDASWLAPVLAHHAGLPLFAPASAAALQAGAQPLGELSALAPWLKPSVQTC